jgi:hypothetical protein
MDLVAPPLGFSPEQIDQSASTREVPFKWVVVVDESLPPGRAVNAAICVAGSTTRHVEGLLGERAVDADGSVHPGLPWIGCTVLGAGSTRLAEIRGAAVARADVAVVDMPVQAQHTRVYDDYLRGVAGVGAAELAYYAVSLFGPRKTVDRLVKGLSLLP